MAEPAWKGRVRARVEDADNRVGEVLMSLHVVRLLLQEPMRLADVAVVRNRMGLANDPLQIAFDQLLIAPAMMRAAELFSLHGASLDPAEPLPSIDHEHVGAQDLAVQNALTKLQAARADAAHAYEAVEGCHGHLATAHQLLDHPGLPSVDALIDRECAMACSAVGVAMQRMQACALQAGGARLDVTGAN